MTQTEILPADQLERARTLDTRESFLVQAPAGSGKTELLTRRLLKLLAEVDEPEEILAITFTIAATAEMRSRVLKALHDAENATKPDPNNEVARLATAALANNKARGWNLLQQPQRLSILTIDAVCLTIAHETPLLSRLGGSLSPTDKPQPLYTLAARRTLARLGEEPALSNALRALLQLRATSLFDCENLIAGMLDKRDQWGRVLPLGDAQFNWEEVRDLLQAAAAPATSTSDRKSTTTVRASSRVGAGARISVGPRMRQTGCERRVDDVEGRKASSSPYQPLALDLPCQLPADKKWYLAQESARRHGWAGGKGPLRVTGERPGCKSRISRNAPRASPSSAAGVHRRRIADVAAPSDHSALCSCRIEVGVCGAKRRRLCRTWPGCTTGSARRRG